MFDVIIIGAGVNGCFIARSLAKYQLKILVIEKCSDVGEGTSGANSAIIHSGYDPKIGTLKAELNALGNKLYEEICLDLDVQFVRNGSLTISTNEEEDQIIEDLLKNAVKNGVEAEIIDRKKLFEIEPFITKKARKALYAKTSGIINPFELCVALMENAIDNGVTLKLNEKVTNIQKDSDYLVTTNKGVYQSKMVINCAGLYGDEINNFVNEKKIALRPRKGEYYLLDHFPGNYVKHTLFSVPSSKGKGILVTPTTSGNYLIGPSSIFIDEKEDLSTNSEVLKDVLREAYRLVDDIPMQHLVTEFSGLRAYHESNDFIIEEAIPNFINVIGMQSPGLASAPATALRVEKMVGEKISLTINPHYQKKRRPLYRINEKSYEERKELIRENPSLGKIICRCEKISEGEIVDAIHRNCGATTVKGVKKRVRAGFGKCQGGFCQTLILKILSRELKKELTDIVMEDEESYILLAPTKEGNYEKL